jgi:hypothetical protein
MTVRRIRLRGEDQTPTRPARGHAIEPLDLDDDAEE